MPPKNNSVLISGASTGLGLETALHLAQNGFHVYAGVLRTEDCQAVETRARQENLQIKAVQLDITDPASIDMAIGTIVKESGGIYGLINNAGTRLRGCFEDLTALEIKQLFDVNVFGTMALTRAVIPLMRKARQGRIVLVTSIAGKFGSFGVSAYCATKFAQEGFGESLVQELIPWGIQVVIVEPAIIKTEAWSINRVTAKGADVPASPYFTLFRRSEELADKLVKSSPTTAQDVARTICKALSVKKPKLRYMVGRRARLVAALRRHLPGELFERIYFRQHLRMITKSEDTLEGSSSIKANP